MGNGESSYRRFLDGDDSAFSEVIDIYRESLIFFINRYVQNLSLSEELAEDCFVELIVYPKRYNFRASLKTFLFTIARNKAVDRLRKLRHTTNLPDTELDIPTQEYESFENEIFKNEQKRILNEAMKELKEEYYTVLHLIYFEEMSNGEAACVMKKSAKQIENLVYRARLRLREILQKRGLDYEG